MPEKTDKCEMCKKTAKVVQVEYRDGPGPMFPWKKSIWCCQKCRNSKPGKWRYAHVGDRKTKPRERFKAVTPSDELAELPVSRTKADIVRDVLWAYNNLHRKHIPVKEAPSSGAWTLWDDAHKTAKTRELFHKNRFPFLMKTMEGEEGHSEDISQNTKQVAEIRQVLAQYRELAEEREKEQRLKRGYAS